MNERILELASKAGIYGLARLDGTFENEAEVKKFAELIVGECLDIVANADLTELEELDRADVLYVVCKQIKQHFGVES